MSQAYSSRTESPWRSRVVGRRLATGGSVLVSVVVSVVAEWWADRMTVTLSGHIRSREPWRLSGHPRSGEHGDSVDGEDHEMGVPVLRRRDESTSPNASNSSSCGSAARVGR